MCGEHERGQWRKPKPWTDEAAAALERLSPAELAERARRAERAAEERRAREQEVRALRRALEAAGAEVPEGAVVGDATAGVDAGVPPAAPAAPRAATLAAAAAAAAGLAGLAGAALALAGHSWGWGLAAGAGVAAALLAWRAHAAAVAAAAAAAREAALAAAAEAAREAAPGVEALRAAQEALEAAQAEAAAAAEAVREALGGLPVAPAFAEAPDVELAQRVRELRRYWEALRDLQEEAAALRRALQAREAGVRDWARRLGMVEGVEDVDALVLARRLEDALDRARRRRREAEQAADERARLQAELRELEAQRAETVRQRDALLERLGAFGPDVEAALLEVRERRDAWQRARFLADALERRPGGLQGVRREVRAAREAGDLPWTDAERGRAAEEERALAEALKETDRRIGELRRELQELETREKAADVAGWIAARAEEREALLRRRDRLALAAALVRLGAERFRERHQPDILKRAGEHLAAFTEGRYDRLLFDEAQNVELPSGAEEARVPGAGAATALLVRRAADGELIPAAPPLSEGTLHQIHLALRLALADHLDEGGERLPACFDETFLHWSERRRRAGLRHLAAWAARRQVLLFTCHPWFAEEAQEEAGATVLRLPG
ncbi:MAG: hypothetical protein IMW98_07330 [Firmicutes bacterium]|nr:hypothetical protein [Bacillota bacterium]